MEFIILNEAMRNEESQNRQSDRQAYKIYP